jgi:hypothetical protein
MVVTTVDDGAKEDFVEKTTPKENFGGVFLNEYWVDWRG